MSPKRIGGLGACVFDAYGTLFNLEHLQEGIGRILSIGGPEAQSFSKIWRDKQLQYTWLRSLSGNYADFRQITTEALDYTLDFFHRSRHPFRDHILALYRDIPCYPEVRHILEELAGMGLRRIVLSNGTPEMLLPALASSKIDHCFESVLSVNSVKVYKPHPSTYRLPLDYLSLPPDRIAYISSNGWDAWSARAFGYQVFWCNRQENPPEHLPSVPENIIRTLEDLIL